MRYRPFADIRVSYKRGKYTDIKELAAADGITSPSDASRILRLALLALNVQENILLGEESAGLALSRLIGAFPVDCNASRDEKGARLSGPLRNSGK